MSFRLMHVFILSRHAALGKRREGERVNLCIGRAVACAPAIDATTDAGRRSAAHRPMGATPAAPREVERLSIARVLKRGRRMH